MAFKTTRLTALFANHSHDADILQPLQSGALLKFVGDNESATNKLTIDGEVWLNLVFVPPGGAGIPGWVLGAHCEVADEVRVALKIDGFVRTSVMLERQFNLMDTTAPWFANAEYVIARAIIETSLSNAGQKIPGSNAVGPLQVSSDEWAALLKDGGAFAEGLTETDRDDPQLQVYAAIFRMNADAHAFSSIKEKAGVDPSDKGYLPTYLDLFQSYLLNSPDAAAAIADAQTTDAGRAKTMKEVLSGLKDEEVAALFAARGAFLGTPDAPKTVGQSVDDLEAKLTAALKQASDLTGQHVPDQVPTNPSEPTIKVVPPDPGNVEELPTTDPPAPAVLNTPAHQAFWPVITDDHQALVVSYEDKSGKIIGNNGRKFFANRRNGARHHVGMDVFCKDGDEVVACADGTIINFYFFYKSAIGEPTYALFVEHDGVVVNYGEVKGDAPKKFGWKVGDKVTAGQKIAIVSSTNMIHFETYVPGTKQNSRWLAGEKRPASLRNPTLLLLDLAANATRIGTDGRRSVSGGSGQIAGSGGALVSIDKDDLLTLARTMYGEAGTQADPPAAREAIAHVVMNRVQRKYLGDTTVSKVCRHDKEFPCWNVDDLPAGQFDKSSDGPRVARISSMVSGADPIFDRCIDAAEQVMKGLLADNTSGATHYCSAGDARPDWTKPPARLTAVIGSRLFFTNVVIAGPGPVVITPPAEPGAGSGSSGDHKRYQPHSADAARTLGSILDLANRASSIDHGFRGVRFLAALPDGQLMYDSELQLDTDGWPGAAGDRTHQNETSYRYANRGSINANEVPFFVLPLPATWPAKFGIRMGDLAAVVFQNKLAFAVFADAGPSTKLGEGSIELHRRLGVERLRSNDTVQDVGMGPGVITVVFPGTRLTPSPTNQGQLLSHIEARGKLLFQQLGGNLP